MNPLRLARFALSCAALLVTAACNSPSAPKTLGGVSIPKGTPIALRGALYSQELIQLTRKIQLYGFAVSADPRAAYSLEVRFLPDGNDHAVCTLALVSAGKTLVSSVSEPVVVYEQHDDLLHEGPPWHRLAFRSALVRFERNLYEQG